MYRMTEVTHGLVAPWFRNNTMLPAIHVSLWIQPAVSIIFICRIHSRVAGWIALFARNLILKIKHGLMELLQD